MLSVSRRPQQKIEKIKVRCYQERGKTTTEPEEAKRYAYLSIDPKTEISTNSYKINSTLQSSEFLNVKFDTKKVMRETYLLKFKEEIASKGIRFSDPALSDKIYNETKSFTQSQSKRNKVKKGEYLRRSCEKMIGQRQQKILSLYDKQVTDQQQLKEKDHIATVMLPDSTNLGQKENKSGKLRKHIFHKMLKKCDRLKQIYRYENELINIIEMKKQCAIKFHTEPFLINSNNNNPFDFPRRKLSNFGKLNKAKSLFESKNRQEKLINAQIDSSDDLNTLDVRKYNNASSVKKRLKFFMRQKLFRQQNYRLQSKSTSKRHYRATQRVKDKQQVGPWQSQTPLC